MGVWLFTGKGDGTFNPGLLLAPLPPGADALAAADFNEAARPFGLRKGVRGLKCAVAVAQQHHKACPRLIGAERGHYEIQLVGSPSRKASRTRPVSPASAWWRT